MAGPPPPHPVPVYAIRARHAFDGTRFLPGGATVVVDAGRIAAVDGPRTQPPAGVEVLEHPGTLLPGLVDCHAHLVADGTVGGLERAGAMTGEELDAVILDSLRAQVRAGVTTVRDLGDRDFRTLGHRDHPGLPRVVAAGPPLTVPGGHCHYLGGAVEGDLRVAVDGHADRGVDLVKVMASGGFATPGTDMLGAQFTPADLVAVVERAHERGLPVVAHAHSLLGIRYALEAGVDGIEHFTGLSPEGVRLDDALLDEAARRGTAVDLTMGNDRALQALIGQPPPPLAALLTRLGLTSYEEFYAERVALLGRLRRHGVTVVSGVDSGIAPPKRHGNVWRTVGEMVEAGFPVDEALAAATSAAARACGLGGETGRLAAGLAADLLLVDGDLARDVTPLGSPRAVHVRGVPGVPG